MSRRPSSDLIVTDAIQVDTINLVTRRAEGELPEFKDQVGSAVVATFQPVRTDIVKQVTRRTGGQLPVFKNQVDSAVHEAGQPAQPNNDILIPVPIQDETGEETTPSDERKPTRFSSRRRRSWNPSNVKWISIAAVLVVTIVSLLVGFVAILLHQMDDSSRIRPTSQPVPATFQPVTGGILSNVTPPPVTEQAPTLISPPQSTPPPTLSTTSQPTSGPSLPTSTNSSTLLPSFQPTPGPSLQATTSSSTPKAAIIQDYRALLEAVTSYLDGERTKYGPIEDWDTSQVTSMSALFNGGGTTAFHPAAATFNADISQWNVSLVTRMDGTFDGATSFNQDLSQWDVHMVTNMNGMFSHAVSFDHDISQWDVSKVTNMQNMFSNATSFNKDLSQWDVSQMTIMNRMFFGAVSFNQNLCVWGNKLPSQAFIGSMFLGATACPTSTPTPVRPNGPFCHVCQ